MLLHDLTGSAGAEGVAFAGEVRTRNGLGDGGHGGGHDIHALKSTGYAGARRDRHARGRTRHLEDGEHVPHPVHHRNGRGLAPGGGLSNGLTDHPLHVGAGEQAARCCATAGAGRRTWRLGTSGGTVPTAPATGQHQGDDNESGRLIHGATPRACHKGFSSP